MNNQPLFNARYLSNAHYQSLRLIDTNKYSGRIGSDPLFIGVPSEPVI